jgi:anti-anti-sigma factor
MMSTEHRDLPRRPPLARGERIARSARSGPVLVVQGALDSGSIGAFTAALLELACSGEPSLTLDLREVEWIDADALGALLRAARRCRANGTKLTVVCSPGPVEQLVRLASVSTRPVRTPGPVATEVGEPELTAVAS